LFKFTENAHFAAFYTLPAPNGHIFTSLNASTPPTFDKSSYHPEMFMGQYINTGNHFVSRIISPTGEGWYHDGMD